MSLDWNGTARQNHTILIRLIFWHGFYRSTGRFCREIYGDKMRKGYDKVFIVRNIEQNIMTILDQLLEKKDLRIYLDMRILQLRQQPLQAKNGWHRGRLEDRRRCRLDELRRLKQLLQDNQIRAASIRMWHSNQQSTANPSSQEKVQSSITRADVDNFFEDLFKDE